MFNTYCILIIINSVCKGNDCSESNNVRRFMFTFYEDFSEFLFCVKWFPMLFDFSYHIYPISLSKNRFDCQILTNLLDCEATNNLCKASYLLPYSDVGVVKLNVFSVYGSVGRVYWIPGFTLIVIRRLLGWLGVLEGLAQSVRLEPALPNVCYALLLCSIPQLRCFIWFFQNRNESWNWKLYILKIGTTKH